MGETKYLANIQIYTTFHWKYQNKSSLTQTSAIRGLYQVVRRSDCAALLVTSPCRAVMLPATTSSDLAGNIGRVAIKSFSNMSAQER